MRDYLEQPFADPRSDCSEVCFVALDLENTGLDPRHHDVLSVGLVELQCGLLDLSSACRRLVQPTRAIPEESAVVHHITDDHAAHGASLTPVFHFLLQRLAGKVLVAHHAQMETGFLNACCQRLYNSPFLIPVVDTQWLARRTLERRNLPYRASDLRLAALRAEYNLPRYRAHDALSDALAAGELFAAQLAERQRGGRLRLSEVLLPQ